MAIIAGSVIDRLSPQFSSTSVRSPYRHEATRPIRKVASALDDDRVSTPVLEIEKARLPVLFALGTACLVTCDCARRVGGSACLLSPNGRPNLEQPSWHQLRISLWSQLLGTPADHALGKSKPHRNWRFQPGSIEVRAKWIGAGLKSKTVSNSGNLLR